MGKLVDNNKTKKSTPVKKKKHGCLGCLGGLLVFILVVVVSGFFIGDYFSKQYLKIGIMDVAQLLSDIKTVKPDKIVTNKYDKTQDLKKLEDNLKEQLFLKDEVEFSIKDFVGAIIPPATVAETPAAFNKLENGLTQTIHMLNADATPEKTDGIIGFVGELYKKENLDMARLNNYDESKHNSEYVLSLSDKELAALGYESIDLLITQFGASLNATLAQFGIANIKDIVALEQIILEEVDGVVAGASAKVPVIKFTVSVDVRDVASKFIIQQLKTDLSFLVKMFLPSRLYVTGQMCLDLSAEPLAEPVFVNSMDAKGMQRIYDVVSGITKATGAELDLRKTINDSLSKAMKSAESVLNQIVDKKVENHAIKIDLFDTIIEFSGLNKNADGTQKEEKLTSSDMIKTLGGIVASDAGAAINTEHSYEHQYYDSATNKVVYDGASTDTANLVDYKKEFMTEVSSKYMLDLTGEDKVVGENPANNNINDDITFDDLMALFGIGTVTTDKKIELLDIFDASKLGYVLGLAEENQAVEINDRMMGAILNSQISTLMTDGSLSTMQPKLEYVIVSSADSHNFVEMGLSVKVASLIKDAGAGFGEIIANLIGEKIVLIVKMDVTPQTPTPTPPPDPLPPAFEYVATQIKYNNLDASKTNEILATINKFGIKFDLSELLNQLETPVRDAMNKMGSVLPIKLMDSSVITDSSAKDLPTAVQLPTIFATIDEMLFKDAPESGNITPDTIRDVLRGIDDVNGADFEKNYVTNKAKTDYKQFMGELQSKYYIKPVMGVDGNEVPLTFDMLFGENGIADTKNFNADKFNFKDANGLFYDTRAVEELKPTFTDSEVAALIKEKMLNTEYALAELLNIQEFTIAPDGKLTLIIKIETSSIIDASTDNKQLDLLPAKELFLKANIDTNNEITDAVTKKTHYETKFSINNMSDASYNVLFAMVKHLNKGVDSMKMSEKQVEVGRIVYDQLNSMKTSLGLEKITFVEHGIEILSFYDFLKTSIPAIKDADSANLKSALQGLMAYDTAKPNDNNYRVETLEANKPTAENTHFKLGEIKKDPDTQKPIISPTYATDRYLGNLVAESLKQNTELGKFTLVQSCIRCKNTVDVNVEFTFKMSGFTTGTSDLSSIIPSDVYITVVLPYNNTLAVYGDATFSINQLSSVEQQIIMDIVGVEQADITLLLQDVKGELTKFKGAKYFAKDINVFNLEYIGYIEFSVQ